MNKENTRPVRIAKEKPDLCYLVSAAIKTTYYTRRLGGVERCIDLLQHLKSLSLSVKEIQLSDSISKLDILRKHRNPNIRKEAQALFHSWTKTLYAHGLDNSLKPKQHLTQRLRRNIEDKDGRVTTKSLFLPPKRNNAFKNIPWRLVDSTKQQQQNVNPKSAAVKNKTELVELFEEAHKAANMSNALGIRYGKDEAYRCVEALSLLMRISITPKPKEPRRMVERLEGLSNHKDRNIREAASSLLHRWRQRIRVQERRDSATKKFPNNT